MKIIVCIKQVPDTTEVKLDPKTGRLIRDGVPSIINPDDKNALEEALRIKDENPDTTVTVVSMGPPQADVAMREALARSSAVPILGQPATLLQPRSKRFPITTSSSAAGRQSTVTPHRSVPRLRNS